MKMPRPDVQFEFATKNLFGSDGLYQNYTNIDGTIGQFGSTRISITASGTASARTATTT